MPSPILPSPPLPLTSKSPKVQTPKTRSRSSKVQPENQDQADPADLVWSQKVRRSYSRLSDRSFSSPDSRIGLFGFEQLQTPEVMRKGQNNNNSSRSGLEVSGSFSALVSFSSMVEAEDCGAEPDPNIPGVALVKEKRRRKKVQQMDSNEVEALAAKMNAEFEEAEEFQLLVE